MGPLEKYFGAVSWIANHPLSRKSKFKAVLSFCVSQVAARFVPGDICRPFPNETKLLVSPRMKGAMHFIFPGLYDYDVMSFVVHFLRRGDLFIDVGANVGAYTLLASGVSGARTVSFEPSPSTFMYLVENVRLNNLAGKVTCINAALGRAEGKIRMTDGLGTENYVCRGPEETGGLEVHVTTMDEALKGLDPFLIKVDVEGFESEVFAGAVETLKNPALAALIVERAGNATRYGFDEKLLHERILSMSFAPYSYSPVERLLERSCPDVGGDIIYIKDFDAAQKRLREAPTFKFGEFTV